MTLYINPIRRSSKRWMLEEMKRNLNESYRSDLTFPIDVRADSDSYTIKALLPGVETDALNIQIVNETVTISGEIKANREEDAHYLTSERPEGKFQRILSLPTELDQDNVEAHLENGVLTVLIPKAEKAKPRTIKVKAK